MAKDRSNNRRPCEATSISAASESTSCGGGGGPEERKKNLEADAEKCRKFEFDRTSGSESRALLDLMKLSSDDGKKSMVEFDFFDPNNMPGSSSRANNNNEVMDDNTREDRASEPKTYPCSFCKREFSSSQALGGHQNAHKQERDMAKKPPGMHLRVLGHTHFPYYPCPGLSHNIYHSYTRALGVRKDSMIHKPQFYGWIPPRYVYGGGGWPRQPVMNSSLTLDRFAMESFQAQNGGFGVPKSSGNPRTEDSTIPFLPIGNSTNSHVAESSGAALNKPTSTSTEDHHVKPCEESDKVDEDHGPRGLDLTLKL